MLTVTVLGEEFYDEESEEFQTRGDIVLHLEHSLVSLSKWESIHETPFLVPGQKSQEQIVSYIECMILDPIFPPEVFSRLSQSNLDAITKYIEGKMTATWFYDDPNTKKSRETITSELIYFWMTSYSIPFACESWHLSRLLTLIRICNIKNSKPKKMSMEARLAQQRHLNEQRQKQYNTTG